MITTMPPTLRAACFSVLVTLAERATAQLAPTSLTSDLPSSLTLISGTSIAAASATPLTSNGLATTLAKQPSTLSNAIPSPSDLAPSLSPVPSSSASTTDSAAIAQTSQPGSADPINSPAIASYYFVALALILCAAGMALYFLWRKRRKHRARVRYGQDTALSRDLTGWLPGRERRRWITGAWRETATSAEEGLNEAGEAPPPYKHRTSGEEVSGTESESGVAVPLQTMSREDTALKPPDYTEESVRSLHPDSSHSAPRTGEASNTSQTHDGSLD